ncbi:unnamed protein product, partial [Ectocarpus sp. 12 AP-2014]
VNAAYSCLFIFLQRSHDDLQFLAAEPSSSCQYIILVLRCDCVRSSVIIVNLASIRPCLICAVRSRLRSAGNAESPLLSRYCRSAAPHPAGSIAPLGPKHAVRVCCLLPCAMLRFRQGPIHPPPPSRVPPRCSRKA